MEGWKRRVEGWKGGRMEDGRVEEWKSGRVGEVENKRLFTNYQVTCKMECNI